MSADSARSFPRLGRFLRRPLHYQPASDGHYKIYSIGWNQLDEDGTIALKSNTARRDDEKGDWVWLSAPR